MGFVLVRARAHRLLLAAALLTVLLTTAVLTTLTAYSGAIGDAALQHSLNDARNAPDTALIVKADVPPAEHAAADTAVRKAAGRTFDQLPVSVRTLVRSGPYALPRSLQPRAERSGDPDLTYFGALDRSQVRLVSGRFPRATGSGDIEVALPRTAAEGLGVRAGTRLTLDNRLSGPKAHILVTGVYRPAVASAAYWLLDDLRGRGLSTAGFTTYGPLLTDPASLAGLSAGQSAWLASADFSTLTTGRIGTLRGTAAAGSTSLRKSGAVKGVTTATTSLPDVLDRIDRSLLVSRSTLLIVALQLALLAGYALLLVARLLSTERAGESRLLRARGGSRARIAGLSAVEALLLALPATAVAPLLAGPLTELLAGHGALARIGLHLDTPAGGRAGVWLVAAVVALGCALAVTLPALTSSFEGGRARAVPAPLRAGADIGLLVVAGVAYWQLNRQTSGAVSTDNSGTLGIDPLLVAAPALALLAGTVLTLRLLPPVARLAERRAAAGRGLPVALAGWQFSRRPMRGAGPVLLLVLALALGMLAIGQSASWNRSQSDQADFQAGVPVRVLAAGDGGLGRTETYADLPRVREAAPAVRTSLSLSGDRTATVLALDTARASDAVLIRGDLTSGHPAGPLLAGLAPKGTTAGAHIPSGTALLTMRAGIRSTGPETTVDVTATVEDRYGTPYEEPLGQLPTDGRSYDLTLALSPTLGPLTLTGLQLDLPQPGDHAAQQRLTVSELSATDAEGKVRRLTLPTAWTGRSSVSESYSETSNPRAPRVSSAKPLTVDYDTGYIPGKDFWTIASVTVQVRVAQPAAPEITAVATDRFLASAGARTGQRVQVTLGGENLPVRIVAAVRGLPTTGDSGDSAAQDGGALLVDLRSVNRVLEASYGASVTPTEWWLRTAPGDAATVAAAVRALPDVDPTEVVVREEIAQELRDDPFGAGPEAAFAAAALVAAALAAVGFAVSTAGSLRERGAEFAVLRALGAPRRQLARMIAAEQGVLVALALVVGTALGTVLTRAVIPLIVLTAQATRPVPRVLVELPVTHVALLLVAVAATPLIVTVALALRRADPATSLREQGGE
ncbi:ABC transporter permease [Streptomyces sp. N50]|uniref:ABC transporter permease n=1 Tax=Streptomyces sp. N50 TaxID=3081765 RepID=UPI0029625A20|nr:ABC transporter permease [Streptomyces sp. N50]WOX09750.1 ABC transporter permease [Streptomyces sp. N50]